MKPYIIYIDSYNHMHGGVRALHVLKDELNKRGIPAFMSYEKNDPDAIVVYPEIIKHNPLESKTYVRWLLNKRSFPRTDICYSWESGMGTHSLLTVNIIELDLWKPTNEKNGQVAYWVGKGRENPHAIPEGAVRIGRDNFPDRKELAKFIAGLDYFITFDPFTAFTLEALVSGVPVLILVNDRLWSRQEIINQGWIRYGVGWSHQELASAQRTVHLARDHYESLLPTFDQRIDAFIEHTQSVFS